MLFLTLLQLAIRNLMHRKGKSFLTMLGIIIGVSSVILIISLGAGAQSLIFNQVEGVGSNLIGILPGGTDNEGQGPPAAAQGIVVTTLKYEDSKAIADPRNVPNIVASTPYVRGDAIVTYGNKSRSALFTGVSADYLKVLDGEVVNGRFFDQDEENSLARVIVLGSQVQDNFFEINEDPVGKNLRLDKTTFRVVGVLKKRGSSGFENQDEQIFMPVSTAQKIMLGTNYVGLIRAKVDSSEHIDQAIVDMKVLLRERHKIKEIGKEDFDIRSQKQGLEALTSITNALKFFLAAIAAISLLVGGIGIMNIMLVTVTERTREIGLRKAIGAKPFSILMQFVIESGLISLLGGLIGIIIGTGISFLVSLVAQQLGYDWDFVVSLNSILLACSVSMAIGVGFGFYPAWLASKLDPIDALRYE